MAFLPTDEIQMWHLICFFVAMKKLLVVLTFALAVNNIRAQYTLYREVSGVEFYTKWGREKWLSKKSPKVLMVKIVNTGSKAVDFDLGV